MFKTFHIQLNMVQHMFKTFHMQLNMFKARGLANPICAWHDIPHRIELHLQTQLRQEIWVFVWPPLCLVKTAKNVGQNTDVSSKR